MTAPIAALVRAALALEGRRPGELGIVLTGDGPLRELNRRWRGLDRATDVLSFGYDDRPGRFVNGDLVVSMDRVTEQARRYRVSRGRELARVVVHGALHLAGLEHRTRSERAAMRAREARVLLAGVTHVRLLERALDAGRAAGPRTARAAGRRTRSVSPSGRPAPARRSPSRRPAGRA